MLCEAPDDIANAIVGADRDRALDRDDVIASDRFGDNLGGTEDSSQIGRARCAHRGADRDVGNHRLLYCFLDVAGEAEAALLQIAADQLFESRLINGDLALEQLRDSFFIDIYADDLVTAFGVAAAAHESHVSAAHDCDVHLELFLDYVDWFALRLVIGPREHLA